MTEETGSAEAGNPTEASTEITTDTGATETVLDGFSDPELKTYAEGKGFDKAGFEGVVKSYSHLEKMMSAEKAGRTVTMLGDDPTSEQFSEFYNKLGRPEEFNGYGFGVEEGEDATFANAAKEHFHKIGLTDAQAIATAEWFNGQASEAGQASEGQYTADIEKETAELEKEWGAAYDKNISDAKKAANEFGFSADEIDGMEKVLGYGGLMRKMHNIGSRLGEDTMEGLDSSSDTGVMTPAAASQAMQELNGNKEWFDAWMDKQNPGHAAAIAKKERLSRLMQGIA